MRAKTPIRDADGKVIGLVSVGISEQKISETLRAHLLIYLLPAILGLGLGVSRGGAAVAAGEAADLRPRAG